MKISPFNSGLLSLCIAASSFTFVACDREFYGEFYSDRLNAHAVVTDSSGNNRLAGLPASYDWVAQMNDGTVYGRRFWSPDGFFDTDVNGEINFATGDLDLRSGTRYRTDCDYYGDSCYFDELGNVTCPTYQFCYARNRALLVSDIVSSAAYVSIYDGAQWQGPFAGTGQYDPYYNAVNRYGVQLSGPTGARPVIGSSLTKEDWFQNDVVRTPFLVVQGSHEASGPISNRVKREDLAKNADGTLKMGALEPSTEKIKWTLINSETGQREERMISPEQLKVKIFTLEKQAQFNETEKAKAQALKEKIAKKLNLTVKE